MEAVTTITIQGEDVGKLKHIQSSFSTKKIGYRVPIGKLLIACAIYVIKNYSVSYVNGKVEITNKQKVA